MPNKERRISRDAAATSERRGGLGIPNLVLREENGNIAFDNRDVTAMAKFNVARGGVTVDNLRESGKGKRLYFEAMVEKYWEEKWECPGCKGVFSRLKGAIQVGQLTPADTRVNRCYSCWTDHAPIGWKDGEEEEYLKIKPYIDKYLDAKTDFAKYEIVREFLKTTDESIPEFAL